MIQPDGEKGNEKRGRRERERETGGEREKKRKKKKKKRKRDARGGDMCSAVTTTMCVRS